jgi:hypothetical protein
MDISSKAKVVIVEGIRIILRITFVYFFCWIHINLLKR